MSDQPEAERIFLTERTLNARWPEVKSAVRKWIDKGVRIEIRPKLVARDVAQNKLRRTA